MLPWTAHRTSWYDDEFLRSLAAVGVRVEDWDTAAPKIENVLCGCTDTVFEAVFPKRSNDLRLLLTESTPDLPALRIAFSVEQDSAGNGRVVYLSGSLR